MNDSNSKLLYSSITSGIFTMIKSSLCKGKYLWDFILKCSVKDVSLYKHDGYNK